MKDCQSILTLPLSRFSFSLLQGGRSASHRPVSREPLLMSRKGLCEGKTFPMTRKTIGDKGGKEQELLQELLNDSPYTSLYQLGS